MKIRNFLLTVLLFTVLSAILLSPTVFAEDPTYSWNINDDGVLTISGTGDVSFGNENYQDWANIRNNITSIVVNEGITSIGDFAFRHVKFATSVSIPSTVKSIGRSAFDGCTAIKRITLPDNLETIGYSAFNGCSSLEEIVIPENVTQLDTYVFQGCSSMKKAVFECSLSALPNYTFDGCSALEDITFPKGLATINTGCFNKCTCLKKVVLPETVTSFGGMYTFANCTSLTEINTENILSFYGRDFENCSSLKTIAINETIKTLPGCMFLGAGITNIVLPKNLQTIGGQCFANCESLESISVPSTVTKIESGVFQGCTALKEFTFPEKITAVYDGVFDGCTSLNKIVFTDNITNIGSYAFRNCTSLKNVTLPKKLDTLGYEAFACCTFTEILIPKSLVKSYNSYGSTGLGAGAPFSNSALETVYFEEGTTSIPDQLFAYATNLKNVDLSNIEKIGNFSFAGCSSFIPEITSKTKSIGNYAFANCTSIEEFEFPTWMETIPDGLLMGTNVSSVIFPKTVKVIGKDAYKQCNKLAYVEFSSSVTDIGDYAFYKCPLIDKIDIPGNVINVGQSAFSYCTNLSELTMHKGTQTIGSDAFSNCNLRTVKPSQTIRELTDGIFWGNPVEILVVPRFCEEWNGWANVYNNFNPIRSFVPANVEHFDIYTYKNAIIYGVEGTAAQDEATRESLTFRVVDNDLEKLAFDKNSVNVSLNETYDAAAILTLESEPFHYEGVMDDNVIFKEDWEFIDSEKITFSSSNEAVATVGASGFVHAEGYGTAIITATSTSGKTDSFTVNVLRPDVVIKISSTYEELEVGDGLFLTADTIPAEYGESFTWSSSDEEVATVSHTGEVTTVGAGSCIIRVKGEISGKTASCILKVYEEETEPHLVQIKNFNFGCDVNLTRYKAGDEVLAALYDSNNQLVSVKIYPADKTVKVEFTVPVDLDLSGASIKVFWWESEAMKPLSTFRLVDIA